MNKFAKLSSSILLVSGLVVATNAMAAGAPTTVNDNASLTKAAGANVSVNVLANDIMNGSVASDLGLVSNPSWGTATCSGTTCVYTIGANSTGKTSDHFDYGYKFTYTDSKGRPRSGVARATVNITLTPTPTSP